MLHAFGGDQCIGELLYRRGFSPNHQDLQAVIVVQVDVQSRQYVVVKVVLHAGEFLAKLADVVVIDQGDGPHYRAVRGLPGCFDQVFADQIAKRFRTIGISSLGDQGVEPVEQVRVDGYANPAKLAHLDRQLSGASLGEQLCGTNSQTVLLPHDGPLRGRGQQPSRAWSNYQTTPASPFAGCSNLLALPPRGVTR